MRAVLADICFLRLILCWDVVAVAAEPVDLCVSIHWHGRSG